MQKKKKSCKNFPQREQHFVFFLRAYCQPTEEHNRGNLGWGSCCPDSFVSSKAAFVPPYRQGPSNSAAPTDCQGKLRKIFANDALHAKKNEKKKKKEFQQLLFWRY